MCSTQLMRRLDLCNGTWKDAYKSLRSAPLGLSDHSVVYLVPSSRSVLRKHKPERCLFLAWMEDSVHCLQDCFSCTDWDVLTDMISSCVSFSFKNGEMARYNILKKQVRKELKIARVNYKEAMEYMFRSNNSRLAWEGVRSTMGMPTKRTLIAFNSFSDFHLSRHLNLF